jgi:ketosteroid isomerase-like protein
VLSTDLFAASPSRPGRRREILARMSQENVELFRRALEAFNRRDLDTLLEQLDPEAEWHPGVAASLGGEATTFRGHEEVRQGLQDLVDAFEDLQLEVSEMRDLGDRVLAMGRLRAHGTESGVEIESPWAYLVEYRAARRFGSGPSLIPRRRSKSPGSRDSCFGRKAAPLLRMESAYRASRCRSSLTQQLRLLALELLV